MKIAVATLVLSLIGCSSGNLDYVKDNSKETFTNMGFEQVGYRGYQWGLLGFNNYGGAKVWWTLHTVPDNGITYEAYLWRWGDELHLYNLKAIDAIKP